ncbi:MAG TPA: glycosyltransferase family 4 protein, partial [Flavisolibacter sp.]
YMGGQKGVALFYKYLQQHVNVFLAVSNDNQDTDQIRTEKLLHPNKKIYLNYFRINRLQEMVAHKKIDIIIAEHSYAGWLAWLVSRSSRKPFIIHSHNIESKRFREMRKWWWRLYYGYERWIHRKADFNFFIADEDKQFAISKFKLAPAKSSVVTYGIEPTRIEGNKQLLREQLGLSDTKVILLFNGTLDYQPNCEAVEVLVDTIEPLLRGKLKDYEIVITGNRARRKLVEKMLAGTNINFIGYVEQIEIYYQAADLFINPVRNDTGVKTKLIEAIANNCTAVSTESGASGTRKDLCGNKLATVRDGDWNSFVSRIMECLEEKPSNTLPEFYQYYNWETITKKASETILSLVHPQ